MRACEGCRRRKIKCDAATTNTWPCAACTRLKLTCVPPTVSYEKESTEPGVHSFELHNDAMYSTGTAGTAENYQQQCIQHPYSTVDSTLSTPLQSTYAELPVYQSANFAEPSAQELLHYGSVPGTAGPPDQAHAAMYATPISETFPAASEHSWKSESGVSTLADVMGDLKINPVAIGTFLTRLNRSGGLTQVL
jgi:Fungal Zn(2)-Cys(6) binuclear cluster domain